MVILEGENRDAIFSHDALYKEYDNFTKIAKQVSEICRKRQTKVL